MGTDVRLLMLLTALTESLEILYSPAASAPPASTEPIPSIWRNLFFRSDMPFPMMESRSVNWKPSSREFPKALVRSVISSTKPFMPLPAFPSSSLISMLSHALVNFFIDPERLSMATSAVPWAVILLMAFCISRTPLPPSLAKIIPPRIASEPKSLYRWFIFSSFVIPARAPCRMSAISAMDFIRPSASKNLDVPFSVMRPRALNSFAAESVCGVRFDNIVLRDVPASDPFKPLFAKTARAVLVSSKLSPTPAATELTAARE